MNYEELLKRAENLNIPINSGIYKPKSDAWQELNITNYELHRRIKEEERHLRENKLWKIAVCSCVISAISAFCALCALILVIKGTP